MKQAVFTRLLAGVVIALCLSVGAIQAQNSDKEKTSERKSVTAPDVVMAAFHRAYPGAEIRNVSTEKKDGNSYFEIESLDSGKHRDILYYADGRVFEVEEEIALADLPAPIRESLKKNFPEGELQKAERITRGSVVQFEVLLEDGEANMEILLDSTGSIKSKIETTDDESHDGDKDSELEDGD